MSFTFPGNKQSKSYTHGNIHASWKYSIKTGVIIGCWLLFGKKNPENLWCSTLIKIKQNKNPENQYYL